MNASTDPSSACWRVIRDYEKWGDCVKRSDRFVDLGPGGMTSDHRKWLLKLMVDEPQLYVDEVQQRFIKVLKTSYSWSAIERTLQEAGVTTKVLDRRSINRDAARRAPALNHALHVLARLGCLLGYVFIFCFL